MRLRSSNTKHTTTLNLTQDVRIEERTIYPLQRVHAGQGVPRRFVARTYALANADTVSEPQSSAEEGPSLTAFASPEAAQLPDQPAELSGPVELPSELSDLFAIPEISPLQTAASVVLTGAITLLLVRSLRRRSKKSKEVKFRSNMAERLGPPGGIDSSAGSSSPSISSTPFLASKPPPSVLDTLSGAVVAGIIAVVLYKFTITVTASFDGQPVSTTYSIRNITIAVRTIISGLCWLATFVFGFNSVGLTLYGIQLFIDPPDTAGLNPPPGEGDTEEKKETPQTDDSSPST